MRPNMHHDQRISSLLSFLVEATLSGHELSCKYSSKKVGGREYN